MRRHGVTRGLLPALAAALLGMVGPAFAVCGDGNGDGSVTVSDGVQALRAAAGLSSACTSDCDVNGNGTITVSDGVNILRKAAGLPVEENCPTEDNPVSSLIGHTLDIFGPLTKVGAVGSAGVQAATAPCDNANGTAEDVGDGFVFTNCHFGEVTFDGFLSTNDSGISFNNLQITRRGDVVTLAGGLSVNGANGGSALNGVLDGDSEQLGKYVVTFQQAVTDDQGNTLDGVLDFDTTDSTIPNVAQVTVTLTGGTSLPVVVRFDDDSTGNFSYNTDTDVLTPVTGPTPRPTPPAARVRLFNIDDRITAFLNGKQVLQAQSTGPNATQDTGLRTVDGLVCGDNVFEFRVENTQPGSGYTFGVQLEIGNDTVAQRSCGKSGSQGCDDNNLTQGLVARDMTLFCVPCGPCTAGAGTCASPLQIPDTGRIQIHGSVSGDNNVSGPCGAGSGPESVFRFTPAVKGCYEFGTCGTSFDSQLSIGDGFCGGDGPLQEQCFDDNQPCAGGGSQEYIFGNFDADVPVTLLLDSKGSQGGDYTLDVRPSSACLF